MIPYPQGLSFKQWADTLHLLRPDITIQPIITDEEQWKDYAQRISQNNNLQSIHIPRPEVFNKWQEWVEAFIRSFGNNT